MSQHQSLTNLETSFETIAKSSVLLYALMIILMGFGFLLLWVGLLVVFEEYPIDSWVFLISNLVLSILFLVWGFMVLGLSLFIWRNGVRLTPATISSTTRIIVFSLILYAIGVIVSTFGTEKGGQTITGIFGFTSAILLLVGIIIYRIPSFQARLFGSILLITGIALWIAATSMYLKELEELIPKELIPSECLGFPNIMSLVGLLIVAVSALFYSFLANGKYEKIAFIILGFGVLIWGISAIITGVNQSGLLIEGWENLERVFRFLPEWLSALIQIVLGILLISTILRIITGFLVLGASVLGITLGAIRMSPELFTPKKTLKCPKCGSEINEDAKFCKNCGSKIEVSPEHIKPTEKFCPNCGTKLTAEAKFCPNCGAKV